ncbi:uncharacterized protein EAF01_010053 [Botrytis porri]|uniref:uncharacterized protein n=1 Tax=Botrytis porri TaxID=87229 RepID=UPI0018FF8B5A|nr:uncharacterized protein EAF01_010053 [Botrytis porri]KAF7894603.1 hypothetical protein EAF01_010053 [Botrytis porri]
MIFYCLAQAVSVLDRGTEDLNKERWDKDEIGHYDMITSNVLIGYCDKVHNRCPVIKIDRHERGAIACRPPEQRINILINHPRHGTCSNIYKVGLIMLSLLDTQVSIFMPSEGFMVKYNERLGRGVSNASYLEEEDIKDAYSQMLRALIMECCMKEPLLRPKTVELQARTGMMFRLCQNKLVADTVGNYICPGLARENVLLEDLEPPKEWLV